MLFTGCILCISNERELLRLFVADAGYLSFNRILLPLDGLREITGGRWLCKDEAVLYLVISWFFGVKILFGDTPVETGRLIVFYKTLTFFCSFYSDYRYCLTKLPILSTPSCTFLLTWDLICLRSSLLANIWTSYFALIDRLTD